MADTQYYTDRMHRIATSVVAVIVMLLIETPVLNAQSAGADGAIRNAKRLLDQGRADSALVILKSAYGTDTTNIELLFVIADAQREARQPKARRATLDTILRLRKSSVTARLTLVEDFLRAKQPDSAAHFAHDALRASGRRSAHAHYWLGRIHEQANRVDSAQFYYRRALTLMPSGELY